MVHQSVIVRHTFNTKLLFNPEQVICIWIPKTETDRDKQAGEAMSVSETSLLLDAPAF